VAFTKARGGVVAEVWSEEEASGCGSTRVDGEEYDATREGFDTDGREGDGAAGPIGRGAKVGGLGEPLNV
jgi:hypothetical protein